MSLAYIQIDRNTFDYSDHEVIMDLYDHVSSSDRNHICRIVKERYNVDLDEYYFMVFGEKPEYIREIEDIKPFVKKHKNIVYYDDEIQMDNGLIWDQDIVTPGFVFLNVMDDEANESVQQMEFEIDQNISSKATENVNDKNGDDKDEDESHIVEGIDSHITLPPILEEIEPDSSVGIPKHLQQPISAIVNQHEGDNFEDKPVSLETLSARPLSVLPRSPIITRSSRSRRQMVPFSQYARTKEKFKISRQSTIDRKRPLYIDSDESDVFVSGFPEDLPTCLIGGSLSDEEPDKESMDWDIQQLPDDQEASSFKVGNYFVRAIKADTALTTSSSNLVFTHKEWAISVSTTDPTMAKSIAKVVTSYLEK